MTRTVTTALLSLVLSLGSVAVAAPAAKPAAPAASPAAVEDHFTGVERVVAVGDLHGDYDKALAALRLCKVIDGRGDWAGGKTHLVQTGDVTDRGPDSRKIMDLLMKLTPQARAAGGRVHALIGNHEAMNVFGDLRYVSDEEFAAFGDPPRGNAMPSVPLNNPRRHREAFSASGVYGRWLRGLNAVVQINETLFLHGGLGPAYASTPLRTMNQAIRDELSGARDFRAPGGVAMDPEGPLWYRGLALGDDSTVKDQLATLFQQQKARRIVLGHTVQERGINQRLGGQLVLIDVGMSRRMNDAPASCLIIERKGTTGADKLTALP